MIQGNEGRDEAADEDEVDEELTEGEERCPICGAVGSPGAMETCIHYVGGVWDGEILWSGDFDEFSAGWGEVSALLEALVDAGAEVEGVIARVAEAGLDTELVEKADPWEWTDSSAVLELIDFSSGEYFVSDGMASGGGAHLYHENPRILREYAERYRRLAEQLRGVYAEQLGENPDLGSK